ncbi:MAG TPA: DUF3857 domain-containing protein [Kofleriaceae bacterium]
MRCWVVACVLGLVTTARAGSPAGALIDAPAFSLAPADLLAAVHAMPAVDADVDVIGESFDYAIGSDRSVETWRAIFIVRSDAGADAWAALGATYRSFQDRPSVRIRVIAANGAVTMLEPKPTSDVPVVQAAIDSDARKLDVALPALQPGDVVEEQMTTVDRGRLVHAGLDWRVQAGGLGATAATRVSVSAPAGQQVRFAEHALPAGVHVEHATADGRETWRYAIGALDLPASESYEPADVYDHPTIAISTIASWNALARELRTTIDAQIAAGPPAWPAGIAKTPAAIVDWARARVRDQSIDVDETAVRPMTPADVLRRSAADSLSQATAIAALLRQLGTRADVALVDISPGIDTEPGLPGLTGFDRALVRAQIAGSDVWIEPSDRFVPIGKLASHSHGRHALVITDDTLALITLPLAAMLDNQVHETCTFTLAEDSYAHVVDVSRESGDFAASNRAWVTTTAPSDATAQYAGWVSSHYYGTLKSTSTPIGSIDAPIEISLDIANAGRGSVQRDQWGVYLWPHDLLDKVPDALIEPAAPRAHDLQLDTPYVYELESRIAVPEGYELPEPAAEQTRQLGPLRMVETQKIDGRELVVTYRLVVDKTRFTPDEVQALQHAASALDSEYVTARSTAWRRYDEGKFRDAIDEIEHRIAAHPREAFHHEDLAGLYITLGDGIGARREARIATQLEPRRAAAWAVLGWTLAHDSFGVDIGFDHDRAAARAAYDKARAIDPKYADAPASLATLLESDAHGRRLLAGPDLRAATAAWRAAYKDDPAIEHAASLARALVSSGTPDEVEPLTATLDRDKIGDVRIAAIALGKRGVAAAVQDAAESFTDATKRQQMIAQGGRIALESRAYEVSRALFAHTDPAALLDTLPELLSRISRHDDAFVVGAQPSDAVIELALERNRRDRPRIACWDRETDDEVEAHSHRHPARFDNSALAIGFVDDYERTTTTFVVQGDASAWRVEATQLGTTSIFYVAADRGKPKIVGAPDVLAGVGRHVLRLLARGDDGAAKRLLDWVIADRDRDALFAALWGPGVASDRAEMSLAAAELAAPTAADRVLPIMTACGAPTPDGQIACDAAVVATLARKKRWAELLDFATSWQARATKQVVMLPELARATALAQLGHVDTAEQLVDAALQQFPDSMPLLALQMQIASASGDPARAWARARRLLARNRPDPSQLARVAWLGAYAGIDVPAAAAAAQQAAKLAPTDGAIVGILAVLEIETGDVVGGKQHLADAMRLSGRSAPGDVDWYAIGRMWEQLGLRDDAIAAYRHVATATPVMPGDELGAIAPVQLAAKRLDALGAKR